VSQPRSHHRDFGFFLWTLPSFLIIFGFITGFTIGMPFFLIGLMLLCYMAFRGPEWPADLGLLAGAGAGALLFWLLPTDHAPAPFIAVGFGLIAFSSLLFWHLRCRPSAG
jgi:hypothetical protein